VYPKKSRTKKAIPNMEEYLAAKKKERKRKPAERVTPPAKAPIKHGQSPYRSANGKFCKRP
jgi:hypothetical protein